MLELAEHIIGTKTGSFDASKFDDRYEEALGELVKAKIEGRALPKRKAPAASKPADLLKALRESANMGASKTKRSAANANKGTKNATGKKTEKTSTKSKRTATTTRRAS